MNQADAKRCKGLIIKAGMTQENFHRVAFGRLRNGQTLLRVFQDGLNLFASHTLKPLEKIIHRCAAFEILE